MRIAMFGATGYGGTEAMRLLCERTDVEVAWLGSDRLAGCPVAEALPQFAGTAMGELRFSPQQEARELSQVDVALLALPHGEARMLVPTLLQQGIRVIDFSGDFRLPDDVYAAWYGSELGAYDGPSPVYGLPEVYREAIVGAQLVANPGCYATCAELALLPLVESGLALTNRLMIDAKSGVSGAGKKPSSGTHFVEVQESVRAYKVGAHQHTPEIEQVLAATVRRRRPCANDEMDAIADAPVQVLLTTQLLPVKRGIYLTAYVPLKEEMSAETLQSLYEERYREEPFVRINPYGAPAEMRHVIGTNLCEISVHLDRRTQTALIVATIDNLGKGAAGQAIQNLNVMFGRSETLGLSMLPWM